MLYGIYTGLTILEAVLLLFSGMGVFDAVTTAMSTAGTGGFSVRDAGIAAYNSAYVEWVVSIFMLIFGINFNLIYLFVIGKFFKALKNTEFITYFIIDTRKESNKSGINNSLNNVTNVQNKSDFASVILLFNRHGI